MTARHPDAALIRTCARHIVNLNTYNASPGLTEYDKDPLWRDYEKTRDAISRAQPKTIEGVLAVARAAVAEAGGKEPCHHGMDEQWAYSVMKSLLRLHVQHP
jgi:hypothetical protein